MIAIAALMIIAAFIAHHPSSEKASEKSEMTRSVEELNQINLKDSEDLGIKRSAEGRIKERKPRKTELLNKINFE